MVVSIRKWQPISRFLLVGAKHASAIILTVLLSVQIFLLYSSISSFNDFWAVLSACLGIYPEIKALICWLILLFWWWLFILLMSFSTYLYIIERSYLSYKRICLSKNYIVLTGRRMFLARRIIILPAHFLRMYEWRLGPSSSMSCMTALGTHPSISGKNLTDLARKMRRSPNL